LAHWEEVALYAFFHTVKNVIKHYRFKISLHFNIYSAIVGQEEIVEVFVENNTSINIQSHSGFTPLYMAAQENHCNIVEFLLKHGANQLLVTEVEYNYCKFTKTKLNTIHTFNRTR